MIYEVALGTAGSDLEDEIVTRIEQLLGREVDDAELSSISDDIYSLSDFEINLSSVA